MQETTRAFYDACKDNTILPIECVVNMALLFEGVRRVVQFDTTFYTDPSIRKSVIVFADSCEATGVVVTRRDACGNVVVYLATARVEVEHELMLLSGGEANVECAFRTLGFADILDPVFYACKGDFPGVLEQEGAVQVSINVIRNEGSSGALLVQMCDATGVHAHTLYAHFLRVSRAVKDLDPALQTTLTFHTKSGTWRASPEYVVDTYRALPCLRSDNRTKVTMDSLGI